MPKEACPNNLAPTASTTAQMALGDALAMSLLKIRGFSTADFAKFHPGGALGKQLYLKVNDIYVNNQKPEVRMDADIKTTILEITSKRLGATVVMDDKGQLAGIITDGDIRRMLEKSNRIDKLRAKDIMNKTPKTIQKGELAVNALQLMRQNNITQIVVMENKTYLGIVHIHDLLKEGLV